MPRVVLAMVPVDTQNTWKLYVVKKSLAFSCHCDLKKKIRATVTLEVKKYE